MGQFTVAVLQENPGQVKSYPLNGVQVRKTESQQEGWGGCLQKVNIRNYEELTRMWNATGPAMQHKEAYIDIIL